VKSLRCRPFIGSLFASFPSTSSDFGTLKFDINVFRLPAVFIAVLSIVAIASLLLFSDEINVHQQQKQSSINNDNNNNNNNVDNDDEKKFDSQPLLTHDEVSIENSKSLLSKSNNNQKLFQQISYFITFASTSCVFACCKYI
jgi:hypothetical protein